MCLNPVQVTRRDPVTNATYTDVVPCGKCIECTKRKQSDYAFISHREARKSQSLYFLTLTYRNDVLPFGCCLETVNIQTGNIVERSPVVFLRPEYQSAVVEDYFSDGSDMSGWQHEIPTYFAESFEDCMPYVKTGTYDPNFKVLLQKDPSCIFASPVFNTPDYETRMVTTPSLRRSDVRDLLKRARQRFYRKYGYYAKFKFFLVGEYGSEHHRPHYHMLLFNCPPEFAELVRNMWYEDFGRADLEKVTPRRGDSLDVAYEKVSRYLAKYLTKGEFEEEFVKCGYVQKPRRISSKNLGKMNLSDIRAYVLAFDVFGEYDPDCPPAAVRSRDGLDLLLSRRYMTITKNNLEYVIRIPKCIYDEVMRKDFVYRQEARLQKTSVKKVLQVHLNRLSSSPDGEIEFTRLMALVPQGEKNVPTRLSRLRCLTSRLISSYSQSLSRANFDQLIQTIKGQLNCGPSSLAFRQAFSKIQTASDARRQASANASKSKLREFYSRSK